jgi:hypothetical protein
MSGPKSEIKLGGNMFGYDTLVKEEIFTELRGRDMPTLRKGMNVTLKGNTQGYIPGHFKPGEQVTIIEFRHPDDAGNSDIIMRVTNGTNVFYIKPNNIEDIVA